MAIQQAQPKPESYGLMPELQSHVPEEEREEQPQKRQQRGSGKRQVAVSRRGPDSQRKASRQEDSESDDADAGDDAADLDASASLEDADSEADADEDLTDDLEAADDEDEGAGEGEGDDSDDKARASSKEDKRTRGQLRTALEKQQKQLEEMQRRLDGQDARTQAAEDAQRNRRAQADDAGDEDELETLLDEITSAGQDKDGFVKVGEQEAKTKQRKKLGKLVETRITGAVREYVDAEAKAVFALPGARDAWNEAQRAGLTDKLKKDYGGHVAPLMFMILREQHDAKIKSLTKKMEKDIARLKDENRKLRLGELPAGQGNRGGAGTGSRPQNRGHGRDVFAAMDSLSKKFGIPTR